MSPSAYDAYDAPLAEGQSGRWGAPRQSFDAASPNDSSRPLRSCTSRLSRGEKHRVSLRSHDERLSSGEKQHVSL